MFNQGGLSLEQAPPVSVVLRFFVTAAFFGTLLGLYLFSMFTGLLPYTETEEYALNLTIIHLLALGVMASFMLGALFQMLPVIAGVVIKIPSKKALFTHLLLILGLILQIIAFNTHSDIAYLLSALLLGLGLLYASTFMIKELAQIKDHSSSSKGMLFSLSAFFIAIVLGIYLLLTLGGYTEGILFSQVKEIHYSFALFGWVSLLIISVSFQVIEMFYITPKYPSIMSKYLTFTLFTLLTFKTIALFTKFPTVGINLFIAILLAVYAAITLHRLYRRKRPTSDATVWFWRLGMGLLIISMSLYSYTLITNENSLLSSLSYLSYIGFALSIVFAMVYKIVPFLVWFHLSNQGYMEAPMMHDVIHPKKAKMHFKLHVTMLLTWSITILFDLAQPIKAIPALLLTISFGWLFYHLVLAIQKYNYTQKYTEKMEW